MANELATQDQGPVGNMAIDIFDDSKMIGALKVAEVISKAEVIPKHYRGKPADCLIAMVRSRKLGTDLFSFMECTYPVNGKLGFEGKYIIALVNQSGIFRGPLRWDYSGDKKENREVVCFAYLKNSEPDDPTKGRVEMSMSYQQAVAHGWNKPRAEMQNGVKVGEKPSPWEADTDQMLAYRSASYLARLYCPNVSLGMYEKEELFDIQDAVVVPEADQAGQKPLLSKFGTKPPPVADQPTEPAKDTHNGTPVGSAVEEPAKTAPDTEKKAQEAGKPPEAPKAPDPALADPKPSQAPQTASQPPAPAKADPKPQEPVSEEQRLSCIETIKRKLGAAILPLAEEYWHKESKNLQEGQTIDNMPGFTAKLIVDHWAQFQKKLSAYADKKNAAGK